jgi:phospholipase C
VAQPTYTVTVKLQGSGTGKVTSSPAGINCPGNCIAAFNAGTSLTITPVPAQGSFFNWWSNDCRGAATCTLNVNANKFAAATITITINQTVKVLNHIIFLAQENRSLDHYFGALLT